jgi:uncharacterized protein (DUF1684 family)
LALAISFSGSRQLNALQAAPPAPSQAAPQAAPLAAPTPAEAAWRQDLDAWRARRVEEIGSPGGWLTLAGMEWLKQGANSVGTAADNQIQLHVQAPDHICLITVNDKTVELHATLDGFPPDLTVDGETAKEGPLNVGANPTVINWHGVSMSVLDRGGHYALRVKDADSPTRANFKGLNWYDPDPHMNVQATWVPFTAPHTETLPTGAGILLALPAPGMAVFKLGKTRLTLEPVLESSNDNTLLFILSDDTTKDATYSGGRYLHVQFPDHGLDKPGKLTLDFNRLENPACAYTTFASCPQPPDKNRLTVPLEAGEKRFTP